MLPAPNAAVGDAKIARRRTVQSPTVIGGVREGILMRVYLGGSKDLRLIKESCKLERGSSSLNYEYGARHSRLVLRFVIGATWTRSHLMFQRLVGLPHRR